MNINPLQSNADKIQEWRDDNPSRKLTLSTLCWAVGVSDLTGMNLTGADLSNADLYDVDLTNVNLTNANLTNAYLFNANLSRVNLTNANLTDANLFSANLFDALLFDADLTNADLSNTNLYDADLTRANLTNVNLFDAALTFSIGGVAKISNVYPYPVNIQPTPVGWYARVGCWYGTLAALHDIATSDDEEDWPEARGDEREQRQPLLQAILRVFDAHVANHPGMIARLAERWGDREGAC